MKHLLTVLIVAVCTAAFAVDTPTVVKRDQPVVIEHEVGQTINAIFGAVEGGSFTWKFLPEQHYIRTETKTYFAAPPGEYIIVVGNTQVIKIIEEGAPDPRPHPQPDPKPDPEPDPDPQPDGIRAEWVLFIEEVSDRSKHPEASNTIRDADLVETIAEIGLKYRVYDDDDPAAKGFLRLIGDIRPAMIILGKDPSQYRVFPAPKSVEEAEKTIRGAIVR